MPQYKVTLFWNQSVFGASETYISNSTSATSAAAKISALIQARNQLLWQRQQWVGVRVAILDERRRSIAYLPGVSKFRGGGTITVPSFGQRIEVVGAVERPDQFRSALQWQLTFDDSRSSIRYLVGLPDGVSVSEPGTMVFTANPDWLNKLQAFFDLLTSQSWQIRARVGPPALPEIQATKLVLQEAAPGLLGIAVPATVTPLPTMATRVHVRGFRKKIPGGYSLNGQYFLDSVNTTLIPGSVVYFLRGTSGQNPAEWKILGTLQSVQYTTFTIQDIRPYRVGIHKRGRPSMAPRGRRLTRLTLDP